MQCSYCRSEKIVKNGYRFNQRYTKKVQRYLCNDCKRTFTPKFVASRTGHLMMARPDKVLVKCPKCGNFKTIKAGIQYQKVKKQRYLCKSCGTIFLGELEE